MAFTSLLCGRYKGDPLGGDGLLGAIKISFRSVTEKLLWWLPSPFLLDLDGVCWF